MHEELIAIGAILLIMGVAVAYIIKAKKSGRKCIGCPDSKTCSHKCGGCSCGCGSHTEEGDNTEKQNEQAAWHSFRCHALTILLCGELQGCDSSLGDETISEIFC